MLEYSTPLTVVYVMIYTFLITFIISNMFQIFVKNEYKKLVKERDELKKFHKDK